MLGLNHRTYAAAVLLFATVLTAGLLTTRAGAGGTPPAVRPPVVLPKPAVAPGHPLVMLLRDHVVHAAPRAGSKRIGAVSARRPLTHARTVLPVLGRTVAPGGGSWVHVRLPGRPNGHAGWISADRTRTRATDWHITIRLSRRTVTVSRAGKVQGRFRAVVGRSSTPTPRGVSFVEEAVPLRSVGGPYALAVSARSHVFQEFGGGDGQIALHGTRGLSGKLGSAVSHGCIRLSPRAMRWLAKRVGPGVPITVRR